MVVGLGVYFNLIAKSDNLTFAWCGIRYNCEIITNNTYSVSISSTLSKLVNSGVVVNSVLNFAKSNLNSLFTTSPKVFNVLLWSLNKNPISITGSYVFNPVI